ncbi:MAG TPA: DUF92 domain-containing protein [Puia sp.]|nr:DUF92 domain-containing protein [Puia sp.]
MHLLNNVIVLLILSAGAFASVRLKKLTLPAGITGGVLGWLVFAGGGYTGLGMLATFFILGTAATGWGRDRKIALLNDGEKGASAQATRTTGQVFANGGVAALTGLGILIFPAYHLRFEVAMAGSLASATADTLSSELGVVYGRRFYNILTWRPDQRGRDGVVSIEGTIIGVAGSTVIAALYAAGHEWSSTVVGIIILAGTIGNLVDSVLGAALERKGYIGNDMVNFLNTMMAGLLAGGLAYITGNL